MPDFSLIYKLQFTDLELNTQGKRIDDIRKKLGDRAAIIAVQKVLDRLSIKINEINIRQKKTEDEISSLISRISTAEQKLYGGQVANPRELQDLQNDIAQLGRQKDNHEDELLAILEESEPIKVQHDGIQEKLISAESTWNTLQNQLNQELASVLESTGKLKNQRDEMVSVIPNDTLELYDQVRSRHPQGKGVARVKNNMCESCLVVLPSRQVQALRSDSTSTRCTSCGLILLPE